MKRPSIDRPFELKSLADNGTFTGYGSVYGEMDSYRDIVMPGAFDKSLGEFKAKGRKVPMLWQHSSRDPIGVYADIKSDDHGLLVTGEINMDVQKGREAHSLMKQGALTGLSIGFNTVMDKWDEKNLTRELHEVELWEISPVTFPAGDSARVVDVKSIEELVTLSDCEAILRDAGMSRKEAAMFISRIKSIGAQSDSADADASVIERALRNLRQYDNT